MNVANYFQNFIDSFTKYLHERFVCFNSGHAKSEAEERKININKTDIDCRKYFQEKTNFIFNPEIYNARAECNYRNCMTGKGFIIIKDNIESIDKNTETKHSFKKTSV